MRDNHRDTKIAVLERYESNLRDLWKLGRFKATAPIKIIYIDISFSFLYLSSFTNSQCCQMFETTVGSPFLREKRRFKINTSGYPKYLCFANYKLYHTKFAFNRASSQFTNCDSRKQIYARTINKLNLCN